MVQYLNEKDPPPSNWVYSDQQGPYPPPQDPVNPYYTSRDGAPVPAPGQSAGHTLPSQSQYHTAPPHGYYPPPVPPQGYYPPPGPPSQGYHPPPGPPSQGYYPPPGPPSQGRYPPQGPPPDYAYVQSHPDGRSASQYEGKDPSHGAVYPPPSPLSPYNAHALDAGPSSSSARDSGHGGAMSLGSFFGNKGSPPMWQRPPTQRLPYNAFPPMCLISNSSRLSKGFPELPPPCQLNPHPFATHDVTEEDWKRFLLDVKKAASLSAAQHIKSNVIPMVTGMSLVTGLVATLAIEKRMQNKNRGAAGDIVDHWNHYFFGPRRMEVVLCQGSERLSGKLGAAPTGDPEQRRMANKLRKRSDDSSSDSSDSSDDDYKHHGHVGLTRREAKKERRAAKRERRAERRARKANGEDKQPYQLFITAI